MNIKMKITFVFFLPFILLLTTSITFYYCASFAGPLQGYFYGFLFYWLFWCILIPVLITGIRPVADLFKVRRPVLGIHKARNIFFLLLPLVFVYAYEFPGALKESNTIIITYSLFLAVINATAEEFLWRGMFFKLLGERSVLYILYSSFGFAIWHFAPQIIFSNKHPGGAVSFVAFAFVLGLLFSIVVRDTGSILLTTIVHILFDFGGLGARLYFTK